MRVLAVEDDRDALDLLHNALVQFGYDVVTARNGAEGLDKMRSGQFSLAIVDWEMPVMTGPEFCRHVRERLSSQYTYIVLLTSRTGTRNVVEGLRAGADEFLTKPFDPHELYVRLRVAERILSLESKDVLIFSMAKLAEARDPETGAHLERMREYCRTLATHLANYGPFRSQLDNGDDDNDDHGGHNH